VNSEMFISLMLTKKWLAEVAGLRCVDRAESQGTSRDFRRGHFWYGDRLSFI